jgi:hypothetical protein
MSLKNSDPAVLVIVYRRHKNLEKILNICAENAVARIYVALDGPKEGNFEGLSDYKKAEEVLLNFASLFNGKIEFLIRDSNVGCAPSVLAACDWAFKSEECVIILEDDCIPLNSFFDYSRQSIELIRSDDSIWLSCGSQFIPPVYFEDSWVLSKYPLNWGWTTTNTKWELIRDCILNPKSFSILDRLTVQGSYWEAGLRRARDGWVDVWDTILVHQMILLRKLAILPSTSLISNIGHDPVATNTKGSKSILGTVVREFSDPASPPVYSKIIEKKLRKDVFRISLRHLISTRITHLWDKLNPGHNSFGSLEARVRLLLDNQVT